MLWNPEIATIRVVVRGLMVRWCSESFVRSGWNDVSGVNAECERCFHSLTGRSSSPIPRKSIAKSCVLWRVNGWALKSPNRCRNVSGHFSVSDPPPPSPSCGDRWYAPCNLHLSRLALYNEVCDVPHTAGSPSHYRPRDYIFTFFGLITGTKTKARFVEWLSVFSST